MIDPILYKESVERLAQLRYDKELAPWFTEDVVNSSPWVQLHNEIISFYKFYGPNEHEDWRRKEFYTRVTREIKRIWPYAKIKMFGSSASRLYLPQSDIDIVVFLPKSDVDDVILMKTLAFKLNRLKWTRSCEYVKARVPIVKLEDIKSGLFMDICFNKCGGVVSLGIMKKYMKIYPQLKFLLITLKAFLKLRGLNDAYQGGLSSFLLSTMIINYFQTISLHLF